MELMTEKAKSLMITDMDAAIQYIFQTRRRLDQAARALDEYTRDISLTRSLLERAQLLNVKREYVVVTGSRGKGSVTAIMAKLLQALGYRVGVITSPHLLHWNERIRIDGAMIPTEDFLRITRALQPSIDAIVGQLGPTQYLSPQGIFLAIALHYFDENAVDIAVLEVGRGGRFDDVAVVPNKLAVFTPIMLEHTALLGETLERIAWHKAGIIKAGSHAISLPQVPPAFQMLDQEAKERGAHLMTLSQTELARWIADQPAGQVIDLPPYGELFLPLLGRYQIDNATLAIRAVELISQQLPGPAPASAAFIKAIRRGLSEVVWLGRAQKMAEQPAIFIDGAITVASAESFVASLQNRLSAPVIAIVGIPRDRDYPAVYQVMAEISHSMVITETDINPNTRFPSQEEAMRVGSKLIDDCHYAANLSTALDLARQLAGTSGTVLLAASLMLVGECMLIWDIDTSQI